MTRGQSLTDEELAVIGVRREINSYGHLIYIIPCDICGSPIRNSTFNTNTVYKCRMCRKDVLNKVHMKRKIAKEQYETAMAEDIGIDIEHYRRFEKASKKFSDVYSEDIEKARTVIERFDSIPEVVACIELLHTGARVIAHQRVGDFTVDFCLPDEKVVVEIDGSIYHTDENAEYMRDYAIKNMLGEGWIVKHIPSDAVMKNHQLFGKAMKRLINGRRFELGIMR